MYASVWTTIIWCCFFLYVCTTVIAQSPIVHLNGVQMEKLDQDDLGILYRDSKGYFWTSIRNNLCCLEGNNFKSYAFEHKNNGEYVRGNICESAGGDLCFSSYAMFRYDRNRDTIIEENTTYSQHKRSILIDYNQQTGILFLDAAQNVIYYLPDKGNNPIKKGDIQGHYFKALKSNEGQCRAVCGWYSLSSNKPGLWFSWMGENGASHTDSLFNEPRSSKYPALHINDVWIENEHKVWISAQEGLFLLNPLNGYTLEVIFPQLRDVKGIVKSKKGDYWLFASDRGLCRFTGDSQGILQTVETNNLAGFSASRCSKIYLDHQDVLWLAFSGEGIAYTALTQAQFLTVNIKSHLLQTGKKDSPVTALVETHEDEILVGTHGAGLLSWNPHNNQIKTVDLGSGFDPSQRIFYLFRDYKRQTWVVTKNRLYKKSPAAPRFEAIQFTGIPDSRYPLMFSLFEDAKHRLWVTGLRQVSEIRQINSQEYQLATHIVTTDPTGVITNGYAHPNGTVLLNNKYAEVLVSQLADKYDGVKVPYAEAICKASDSSVWIGSSKGLIHFNTNTAAIDTPYTSVLSLPAFISNLKEVGQGQLWATSPQAVYFNDFKKNIYKFFNKYYGLNGDAFVKNCILITEQDQLVVANSTSLFLLPIQNSSREDTHRVQIHLKNLFVNDKPLKSHGNINLIEQLAFPYDSNTITFEFLGIDYFAPDLAAIEYRMGGLDKPDVWVSVAEGATAISRYPNLAPGDYYFQVRSKDQKSQKTIYIRIAPPYYATWWFRSICLLLAGGVLYAISRYRLAQLMREKTLEQQKQAAELNALRAIINPHFLFNALNSINAFILTKKTEQANEYLADFSLLIRQMFDHSQNPITTIKEELDMLESYIKVEQRRFRQPFEYRVEIHPDLDAYSHYVPSMILQPFVENAIWHGLQHRTQPGGLLRIIVYLEGIHLVCVIEDNGVGRAKAAEIKQRQGTQHKSQGLHLTRLRIEQTNSANSLETIDLFDPSGHAAGTKVIVRINRHLA